MKSKIAEELEKLKSLINRNDYLYYVIGEPEISDYEYDKLYKRLLELEGEYPNLVTTDSPSQRIGGQPLDGFSSIKHLPPMLSLDNTYNEGEIREFDQRVRRITGEESVVYSCEPKIDGVAITLVYEDGVFIRGGTRGDGKRGDDITANLRTIKSIPLQLLSMPPGTIEVRGEAYMTRDGLASLNRIAESEGRPLFANPRNATAGSLKLLDSKEVAGRPLKASIFALYGALEIATQEDSLKLMAQWGLPVIKRMFVAKSIEEVISYHKQIAEDRAAIPYNIDGIVVKVNQTALIDILGATSKSPRWAIAFKFEAEQATTTIESIEWSVGRQGHITPVANLIPVELGGTTVKRAGLYNIDNVEDLDIREGDRVIIEKGGEIIPKVVEVLYKLRKDSNTAKTSSPESCPACDSTLIREEDKAGIFCANFDCPVQVQAKIAHFGSRTAMDVEGLGDAAAITLYEELDIRDVGDLFFLDTLTLQELEGWGEKSAKNLVAGLEECKSRPLSNLLYALGIPGVGLSTAELLIGTFHSISALNNATIENIAEIHGIGDVVAQNVKTYLLRPQVIDMLDKLRNAELTLEEKIPEISDLPLAGLTFVITGTLQNFSRGDAEATIRKLGGKATASVSKNTDYLVAGEGGGRKLKKAEKLGTIIIDEAEFETLLSGNDKEETLF